MNKPYYTEYVRHCLRFYSRNPTIARFNSLVDKENWYACHRVIENYSDRDTFIILRVYSGYDTIADNVYDVARLHNIDQNIIWDMIKDLERTIAKKRGLL